ncbi:hypothetical protein [Leptospira yasudae]|uniref:hypothetical protein n=1 Tax=Leptospira yasudae TaxID=2202201 RepID=UPI0010916DD2|nr:hypothetical protein [Leptospira yasudae]TGN02485.1 hypothetical protein EHR10_00725 [Leptospira yasudae]
MNQAKIILILTLFASGCQSINNEQVSGEEAIKRISKEIQIISIFEGFGGYGMNPNRCVGFGTTSPAILSVPDMEPNEVYAAAQVVTAQYPQFSRTEVMGMIGSGTDKDVFKFYAPMNLNGTFSLVSGSAQCKISSNMDETSNMSFTSMGASSPLIQGAIGKYFALGPTNFQSVYVGCEGITGQDYVLRMDVSPLTNPQPGASFSVSPGTTILFGSHLIFIEAMGIEKSRAYSGHSVDRCIDAIRTKGALLAVSFYNRSFSTCEINRASYETQRIGILKPDCSLEPAKITVNKIYGTGQ